MELSLPAGSLQAALQAFAGGADSVYLGLRQYSARKSATNFSFEELAQLKGEAVRLHKKIYVALNTVLEDSEIDHITPLLRRLELLNIDGVIVQDLGLASIIAFDFPSLPLHCSTQLAVHTIGGVKELQRLGFSRIILSRELTFKEIEGIRKACPEVDLKVFIHGALCYGFSGLCMASRLITGRSANRGECAQICRTWFNYPGAESDQRANKGYCFSMTDLALDDQILRLRDIGIDAVKIEGRMKSPAYVYFAAQYYRKLLDGKTTSHEELRTQFSRTPSAGWMFSYGKEKPQENRHTPSLVDTEFPGHKGIEVGRVVQGCGPDSPTSITITLTHEIAIRDGLMLLIDTPNAVTLPVRFGLSSIQDRYKNELFRGKANSTVRIQVPFTALVTAGAPLYRVSQHNLNLPEIQESSLKPYRYPITLDLVIHPNALVITANNTPKWISKVLVQSFPIEVQPARKPQNLQQNLENVFTASTETGMIGENILITNQTGLADHEVFIPLSIVKDVRRSWYEFLHKELEKAITEVSIPRKLGTYNLQHLPSRSEISPHYDRPIPWIDPAEVLRLLQSGMKLSQILAVQDGIAYLPLAPIMFEEQIYLETLDLLIEYIDTPLYVGINNIAQLAWARKHSEINYFIDIYVYMANRYAAALSCATLPSLIGMYHWVERNVIDTTSWPGLSTSPGSHFSIPLFISRSCYRYDTLKQKCEGCPRRGNWTVEQNEREYRVMVRDCITIVSEQPK